MARENQETMQAEILDTIVENVITGDRDLFDRTRVKSVSLNTLELIDLATFIIPPGDSSDTDFLKRMQVLAAKAVGERHREVGRGKRNSATSLPALRSIVGVWSTIAAFLAALVMEPMPKSGTGLVDRGWQPWYKYPLETNAAELAYSGVPHCSTAGMLEDRCAC